jgi:hypothetical protein
MSEARRARASSIAKSTSGSECLSASLATMIRSPNRVPAVWGYCLLWIFIEDRFKLQVYKHLELGGRRHNRFLERLKQPLHPAG